MRVGPHYSEVTIVCYRRQILRVSREHSSSKTRIIAHLLIMSHSHRLSDESGSMKFTLLEEGKLTKSKLSRKDGELTVL